LAKSGKSEFRNEISTAGSSAELSCGGTGTSIHRSFFNVFET